jgi:hypothetical protein
MFTERDMPMSKVKNVDSETVLLPARQVWSRYGVHVATIDRWVEGGFFPPPDLVLRTRRYWRRATLETWERAQAVAARKAAAGGRR